MNSVDSLRSGNITSWAKPLSILGVALGSLAAGVLVTKDLEAFGLFVVGGVLFAACFIFWRPALYGVFIAVIVEGFLRNYFDSPLVLLVKDLMLAAIYMRVFGQRMLFGRWPFPASPINRAVTVFMTIVLAQTFNPNLPALAVGIVGIRTWLYYLPLYYIALEMFQTETAIERFLQFILVGAVPLSLFALLQAWLGPAAYANLGPTFAKALFTTASGDAGVIYRPNATFAWSSPFAIYLSFCTFGCLGQLLAVQGWRALRYWLLLGLLIYTSLVEGQRLLFVLMPLLFAFTLVLRRRGRLGALILGSGAAAVIVASIFPALGASVRIFELFSVDLAVFGVRATAYWNSLTTALTLSPIGLGSGATSIGSRYVVGSIPLFVENPFAKAAGDLSVVGLLIFLWLCGSIVVDTLRTHRRLDRAGASDLASLAAALMAYELLIVLFGYDLAAAAIPFWFAAGLAHALGNLRPNPGLAASNG